MATWSRRGLLQASTALILLLLSGCTSLQDRLGSQSPQDPTATDRDPDQLTTWERSTACDSMHDSIIKVERTTSTLREEYDPIHFTNLSAGEQTILATVTDEGGYGTCDTSDAFERFLNRVIEHLYQQDQSDSRLYLERGGTYYQLYIEDLDQIFAH